MFSVEMSVIRVVSLVMRSLESGGVFSVEMSVSCDESGVFGDEKS